MYQLSITIHHHFTGGIGVKRQVSHNNPLPAAWEKSITEATLPSTTRLVRGSTYFCMASKYTPRDLLDLISRVLPT